MNLLIAFDDYLATALSRPHLNPVGIGSVDCRLAQANSASDD
jgi:hypothetical protein